MIKIQGQGEPVRFQVVRGPSDARAPVEISVVVPVYNRERELPRALASIAAQTFPASEVIVVDDRSSDRTVDVACAYAAPFELVVLRHERNAGASAARNTGMSVARGRLIAFLDSDDEWLPEKLERQMAERHKLGGGNLVLLSRVVVRGPLGDTVEPPTLKRPDVGIADFLFRQRGLIQLGTLLMPARFARTVRFEEGQQINEDWEFCLSLEEQGADIRMTEEPLLVWYDESRGDRLSLGAPAEDLLAWLERHRHRISHQAYLARRATIAPRFRGLATSRALGWIVLAKLRGASSTMSCIGQLCRLVYPPSYVWLQRLSNKGSTS